MKAQFLKMAGVNSEDEFYNMFPTEESFFQAYPEARTYANGGATYPYPGQATADQFFNYGMQGKGAGAQIPVETWFAYGGFTSKPSATLVHYEDGGMGQHSSPFNYGAFPAFAKKGNQVQGGGIDAATGTIKDNFLAAIQKNNQLALNKQAAEQAMEIAPQVMPELLASTFRTGGSNLNAFTSAYEDIRQNRANKMGDFMGSVAGAVSYETDKRIKQNMYDEFNKKLNELMAKQKQFDPMKDAQTTPGFNPVPENMAKLGGSLKKFQEGGKTNSKPKTVTDLVRELNEIEARAKNQNLSQTDKQGLDLAIKLMRSKINEIIENEQTGFVYGKGEHWWNDYRMASGEIDPTIEDEAERERQKDLQDYEEYKSHIYNYIGEPAKGEQKLKEAAKEEKKAAAQKPVIEEQKPEEVKKAAGKQATGTVQKTPQGVRYTPGTTPVTSTTPKTTGTPATTGGGDSVEAAVKQLATAYGVDPDQTWQNYQSIISAYGTRGAGTGYPSYFTTGDDYRYRGRGKGSPFVRDIGYMPTPQDIQAMQAQANQMGYGLKVTEKPRFLGFGAKKIIIETTFNPNTGKVEETPKVVDETPAPTWGVQPQTPSPLLTPQDRYNLDKEQAIREGEAQMTPAQKARMLSPIQSTIQPVEVNEPSPYMPIEDNRGFPIVPPSSMKGTLGEDVKGYPTVTYNQGGALNRFLPKHDMLGQTGGYEGKPVNSIFDTLSDIQDSDMTGTTGIPGVAGKKTGSKGVYKQKIKTPPWMADTMLTDISALSSMASGNEEEKAYQQMAQRMRGDYVFGTSGGKDVGTYVPTGALTGVLSPNLYNPAVDTGYMGGFKKDRGGSVAYSDWSQTPVNGYYGIPQGKFNPYSSWSQSPVRMQSGGAMMQDGVYDLSEDEINAIIQAGGQVEFLD